MASIIDRRTSSKKKTSGSRQRFIRRLKGQAEVKKSIQDAVTDTNIKDIGKKNVKVKVKNLSEPTFQHDPKTGRRTIVAPGNDQYVVGDEIWKPDGGGRGPGGDPSDDGESEDEFSFGLTKEEFMDLFMEDFALPNLEEKKLKDLEVYTLKRAGFSTSGSAAQRSIEQTARRALARRIALRRPSLETIEEAEKELEAEENATPRNEGRILDLQQQLADMKARTMSVPWIDPVDERFRNYNKQPKPITSAVMFCLMDVSGSMGEREKDIGKRFFILLYLLLLKTYKNIDIVFVRHHTVAEEVDEHTFFYDQTSGGTVVSTGYEKINQIIDQRYNPTEWNIYTSQVSDGDNSYSDHEKCVAQMDRLMARCQYHAYLEAPNGWSGGGVSDLWKTIEAIKETRPGDIGMVKAMDIADIWKAFTELFGRMEKKS